MSAKALSLQLALPDADDHPVALSKLAIDATVSPSVALDLQFPERGVVAGRSVAVGTPVPEASVHEQGDLLRAPREVGSPGEVGVPSPAIKFR